jgi:alpha-galactosidase
MTTRREFIERASVTLGASLPLSAPAIVEAAFGEAAPPPSFLDLRRPPSSALAQTANGDVRLSASGGRLEGGGVVVTLADANGATRVQVASSVPVRRLRLRWAGDIDATQLILGDAWERGYGDLEWRGFAPDRVMPWYVATWDGRVTHGYGVRTGANAFCFWQLDPQGINLWIDLRSGGMPLVLGERALDACEVVARPGRAGESAFAAVHAFCRMMCPAPRLPAQPVYGSNDWYWAYGRNSADTVLTDAKNIVDLSPVGGNRPFAVIDDGWQPERGADKKGVGTWDRGNEKFPDMPGLAAAMRKIGARPGIWVRPLLAPADAPDAWRLARARTVLDPTVPEVRQKVVDDLARIRGWGYELIKHDYSSFDVFGRWGFQMGADLTRDGWTFASGPSRTTAEVVNDLYRAIRTGAGDTLVIGCNTVSHLSAGVFDICRIGDDTSGRDWPRTRKMGVNTLAFRGAQHGAFYVADADCVGVTNQVPWNFNRQWLDLLARSGTMLFVSLDPSALGDDQRRDLKAAFAIASQPRPLGEPLDWQHSAWPRRWRLMNRAQTFDWVGNDGSSPAS